jgi:hypothetical protein
MKKARPSVVGGKMKWYPADMANWIRDRIKDISSIQ